MRSLVEKLPTEIAYQLAHYLNDSELAHLYSTSKMNQFLFAIPLKERLKSQLISYSTRDKIKQDKINQILNQHNYLLNDKEFMLQFLLTNGINGVWDRVDEILDRNPDFLLEKGNVGFGKCKLEDITLFQLSLWAIDSFLLGLTLFYFKHRIDNGLAIAQKQYDALSLNVVNYIQNIASAEKKIIGEKVANSLMPLLSLYREMGNRPKELYEKERLSFLQKQSEIRSRLPPTAMELIHCCWLDESEEQEGYLSIAKYCEGWQLLTWKEIIAMGANFDKEYDKFFPAELYQHSDIKRKKDIYYKKSCMLF